MPFNGPIDGDYSEVDFTKAPWVNEIMPLTHDECVQVIGVCEEIKEGGNPNGAVDANFVVSEYNMKDWQYAISLDTYTTLEGYDLEVNTLGIDENGIIQPEVIEEEPTPEEPSEDPIEEDTTEVVEEGTPEAPTEETTTEDPAE
jgi:hypothetical protein